MEEVKERKNKYENTLMSWSFPESESYERGWLWYAGVLFFGLLFLIYAVWVNNYLFVLIVLIAIIIMFTYSVKEPEEVNFVITDEGVGVNSKFYSFEQLKNFWIVYNPPLVKKLFLEFKSSIRPELTVNLGDQNPLKVREVLLKHIEENLEREEEPFSDEVARWLKI
ncbi:MAG: hypothetical protein PHD51_02500 [Patescibacteria group bacterium]|nr:hypothetical protein [Patescibacteria group bacterium]MDD5490269.1 hypothetical protein [Patescibacteria group bacterium]